MHPSGLESYGTPAILVLALIAYALAVSLL